MRTTQTRYQPGKLPAPTDKASAEQILDVRPWTEKLLSFRTTRSKSFRFTPGQFARIGITSGTMTSGIPGVIWRPYSMVSADYDEYLEFFSIIVPGGAFSSRLAQAQAGDLLYVEKQPYGYLTANRYAGGGDLWLLASGTGIAPFLSILRDPDVWSRFDHLVLVYSVRASHDLAYREAIAAFSDDPLFAPHGHKLRFVPVVTREHLPGMLDRRLTELVADGTLERHVGMTFTQERTRILMCGNPTMIDDLRTALQARGLRADRSREPGNFAAEGYW